MKVPELVEGMKEVAPVPELVEGMKEVAPVPELVEGMKNGSPLFPPPTSLSEVAAGREFFALYPSTSSGTRNCKNIKSPFDVLRDHELKRHQLPFNMLRDQKINKH